MKKSIIALLILFSFLPTCESVWGFSAEHEFIWKHHLESVSDSNPKNDNNISNITYFSCSNEHSSSHSSCKDCCGWKDENLEISLPSIREPIKFDLNLDTANYIVTFDKLKLHIKDLPCDKLSDTIKLDKLSYFNLVGIIKNLN